MKAWFRKYEKLVTFVVLVALMVAGLIVLLPHAMVKARLPSAYVHHVTRMA